MKLKMPKHKARIKNYMTDIAKSGINRAYRTERPPSGVRCLSDIHYMEDDDDYHLLDIFYPENACGALPIIVNIHGGGFGMNSKEKIYRYYAMRLAKLGFAVLNINYSLSISAPFPAQINDILAVLKFIENYNTAFQLDTRYLFLVGDSAGAYLAALTECILTNDILKEKYNAKTKLKITALGLCCGMYDFDTFLGRDIIFPAKRDIVMLLFGSINFVMLPIYQFTSVYQYMNKKFCPTYIMDTNFRSFVPEAKRLRWILDQNGIPYQIRMYSKLKKLPHVFHLTNKYEESRRTRREMTDYFKSFIK